MLRTHQNDALVIAGDPEFGRGLTDIMAAVTPGGGKSSLPVILGLRAIAMGLATKICWVVPRDSLKKQAAAAFMDPRFRELLGHRMEIRDSGNDLDPSRGSFGYATTYHAIGVDPQLHCAEFHRHRYVLVLDELHHVAEGSLWHEALQRLVDSAVMVIRLSGTLSRDDGKRIAFVRYDDIGDGTHEVQLQSSADYRVIRYTRAQGLAEKAILPIYFERVDGAARWRDTKGVEREVGSLVGAGTNGSQAVFSLLRSDFARDLLRSMIEHWKGYVRENPNAKFLVVAPTIAMCREYLRMLHHLGVTNVDKATSDDGEGARNIDRLKGRVPPAQRLQGIVTVGMAYEGLDCPEITHIACLTQVRSAEWLEQMLARATRVDYAAGPYEEQAAHVWAPDDDAFSAAIKRIREEQAPYVVERDKKARKAVEMVDEDGPAFEVLEGTSTAARAQDVQTGAVIESHELGRLKQVQQETGFFQMNLFEIQKVVDPIGPAAGAKASLTLKEQERLARKKLHQLAGRKAGGNPKIIIEINTKIRRRFGVPRENMSVAQLNAAINFLEQIV